MFSKKRVAFGLPFLLSMPLLRIVLCNYDEGKISGMV